jgi:hypothetical protein
MVLLLLLSKDCCRCWWKKNLQFAKRCKQFEGPNEEEELWITQFVKYSTVLIQCHLLLSPCNLQLQGYTYCPCCLLVSTLWFGMMTSFS